MATHAMTRVLQDLRQVVQRYDRALPSDGQLLGCFIEHRDEAAFELLVRRHGPMVMGVCLRVLHNQHDAEDAFQATFLVLVRKAASVVPPERLANWLYGVAHQTALRARVASARRRAREKQAVTMISTATVSPEEPHELQPLLDQELSRLPEKYRVPIVLCDLEGMTRKEVAGQLGWPEGSVSSRLARARALLARRLGRRGLALGGGTWAGLQAVPAASGCVPTSVVVSTVKAATVLAAGRTAAAGLISAETAALTDSVVKTMFMTKLKSVLGVLLVIGMVASVSCFAVLLDNPLAVGKEAKAAAAAPVPPVPPGPPKLRATFDGEKDGTAVAISGDGKLMASEGEDEIVNVWDVGTTRVKAAIETGHKRKVSSIAMSGDGKVLVTGGEEGTAKLWDVATRRLKATLEGHKDQVTSVAISSNGKLVASASADGRVKLWDAATGREKATLEGHKGKVNSVAISGDGKLVVSASDDKTVKVWDAATGREKATLEGHTDRVIAVAISGDGKLVVSSSEDDTVKLWEVSTGREKATLMGHKDKVASVAISGNANARLVATASGDGTVKLWDAATGREKATLEGSKDKEVSSVAISSNGKLVVAGSRDAKVQLWDVP
jgi:RNA polymerase sigma factor (sigma-70 family)